MSKPLPLIMAMILCGAYPAMAQRPEEHPAPQAQPPHNPPPSSPRANNGRIPPPPPKRTNEPSRPQQNNNQTRAESNRPENHPQNMPENRNDQRQRRDTHQENERPQANVRPHVENDQWYGHDDRDDRYRVARPYERGHFEHFGRDYRYRVERVDRDHHEFWFPGGFYFQIAAWDWPVATDWCWNCGDNFVVYEDPDHPGWYLVYDTDTGEYVHAQYMGG
jgi:hypothetical protein